MVVYFGSKLLCKFCSISVLRVSVSQGVIEHWQKTGSFRQVLMKQKEAQAIRRLIQEKDAQDRGMGREQLGIASSGRFEL